jgi:uncharacterized membrane protein
MDETTMNSSAPILTTSTKHGRQDCNGVPPLGWVAMSLNPLTHILMLMVFASGLLFPGSPVFAGPQIEISFEADSAESQKLIHAQAVFAVPQPIVYNIFKRITTYPMLHDWVRETTRVSEDHDSQVYLVKFSFPWPVGNQWSRVEVRHGGNTIFWKQVDGSLEANHGRISFTTVDSKVHLDYRAAIDVGLPELWTRSYKEKFIREFLTAAYNHAETTDSTSALVLAVEP